MKLKCPFLRRVPLSPQVNKCQLTQKKKFSLLLILIPHDYTEYLTRLFKRSPSNVSYHGKLDTRE